jgi:hypothetical protein
MMIGAIGNLTALWFLEQELLLRIGRMLNLPGLGQKLPAASLDLTSSSDL